MLYSKLFGKTQKNIPQQFESKNHELLVKAGFIDQVASGIYNFLPLGNQVLTKIEDIVRNAMNSINAQEIIMPLLHPKNLWVKTDRWNNVDVLFKTKSRYDHEFGLAPTHEEIVTPLAKKFIKSFRDLPLSLYQITTKFRDEQRAKSGILRGKEFRMKDLYSFHIDEADFKSYYKKVMAVYLNIFSRCCLNDIKITEASGGSFSKKFSHEFNVLTQSGEVDLIYCQKCNFAQNLEVATVKEDGLCPKCSQGHLKISRAIEVGNIFDLGTKFSHAFELKYINQDRQEKEIVMGCYGIGTSRLVGAVVEIHHDDKGIVWPESVAPYQIHLIGLDLKDESIKSRVNKVYEELLKNNIEVLFDDRENVTAGEKFADADLIGIPVRLVISKRTGDQIEYKKRLEKASQMLHLENIIQTI